MSIWFIETEKFHYVLRYHMDIEKELCQFCGKPAKHFLYAAFVCDSEECIEKARAERGGPGGHLRIKSQ